MTHDEIKKHLENTNPDEMASATKALKMVVSKYFERLNTWDDIYETLDDGVGELGRNAGHELSRKTEDLLYLTFSSLFVKGYLLFRQSQPRMTDFDLAKTLLLHHVHNVADNAYGTYLELSKRRK